MSFEFDFTPEMLAACMPSPRIGEWYDSICEILPDYEIASPLRIAAWLAQVGHESGDLKFMVENLNYGAKGLRGVFGKYFPTDDIANHYQRQPEMIANRVYSNRMGNGPENSGDGWKFRGRGLIQITGRDNYLRCSQMLYGDNRLLDEPDLICEPDGAIRSACWFWNSRNLNDLADVQDIKEITRKINGGYNGLDDRVMRYERALQVLGGQ